MRPRHWRDAFRAVQASRYELSTSTKLDFPRDRALRESIYQTRRQAYLGSTSEDRSWLRLENSFWTHSASDWVGTNARLIAEDNGKVPMTGLESPRRAGRGPLALSFIRAATSLFRLIVEFDFSFFRSIAIAAIISKEQAQFAAACLLHCLRRRHRGLRGILDLPRQRSARKDFFQ